MRWLRQRRVRKLEEMRWQGMQHASHASQAFLRGLGPRRVGGRYRDGRTGEEYEVLEIVRAGFDYWIAAVTSQGKERSYLRPWDPQYDEVISQPGEMNTGE